MTRAYAADGYLADVYRAVGTPTTPAAPSTSPSGSAIETYTRDALGRVTSAAERGGTAVSTYNMRSELTEQTFADGYVSSTTTYDYNLLVSGAYTGQYQGGVVTHSKTVSSLSGVAQPDQNTDTSYAWWQSAQQDVVTYKPDTSTTTTTTYSYDVSGRMTSAAIVDASSRTYNYTADAQGQVIIRTLAGGALQQTDYRFNGRGIGTVASDVLVANPGSQRYADFDQGYTPVGSSSSDHNGTYAVDTGDTLRIIAEKVWGDASLWYKLAEANGLTGDETLATGRGLIVPQNVVGLHHSSTTFQPYDPNRALGDTFPSGYVDPVQPQPPAGAGHHGGNERCPASSFHPLLRRAPPGVKLLRQDVVAPRHVRHVGARFHALSNDPRPRLVRPLPTRRPRRDHIHPLRIRAGRSFQAAFETLHRPSLVTS